MCDTIADTPFYLKATLHFGVDEASSLIMRVLSQILVLPSWDFGRVSSLIGPPSVIV